MQLDCTTSVYAQQYVLSVDMPKCLLGVCVHSPELRTTAAVCIHAYILTQDGT